jgi:hypothetical protein
LCHDTQWTPTCGDHAAVLTTVGSRAASTAFFFGRRPAISTLIVYDRKPTSLNE